MLGDLGHEAGLSKLEEDAQTRARAEGKSADEVERIYYTIYANSCSDPGLVRNYLDSGMLAQMIAKKEAKMLATPLASQEEQLEH